MSTLYSSLEGFRISQSVFLLYNLFNLFCRWADFFKAVELKKDVSEDEGELSRTVSLMETDDFEYVPSLSHVSLK
jgi:hypothetical protein